MWPGIQGEPACTIAATICPRSTSTSAPSLARASLSFTEVRTTVLDLETGHILWAAVGSVANALAPFLFRLKQDHAQLEAIAMDMWPTYL